MRAFSIVIPLLLVLPLAAGMGMAASCCGPSVANAQEHAGRLEGKAAAAKQPPQKAPPALKEMKGNICPVMAGPINKKNNYTYKGTSYYFCCPICIDRFKAEPEKYIEKMPKKQG